MLLLFFKSALIFRNTYDKEDAVLVFTGLERGSYMLHAQSSGSDRSISPLVCYQLCRSYRIVTSNTNNVSVWTSVFPHFTVMGLPCRSTVGDVAVNLTNLGLYGL
jgi:hypothetical protein